MGKILDDKLTNKSIMTLQVIMDAINAKNDVNEILMCLLHAKLTHYSTRDEITERFGTRAKMEDTCSYILDVINGMANEIERLNKKLGSCMYCEKKLADSEAIILCKECTE